MPEYHLEQTISTGGAGLSVLVAANDDAKLKLKVDGQTFHVSGSFSVELPPTTKKIPIELEGQATHIFLQLAVLGLGETSIIPLGLSRVSDAKLKVKVPKNNSDFFLGAAITGPEQHFGEPDLSGRLTVHNGEKRVIHTLIESKLFGVGQAGFEKKVREVVTENEFIYNFEVLLPTAKHDYELVFKSPEVILQSPNYIVSLVPSSPFNLPIQPQPKSFKAV